MQTATNSVVETIAVSSTAVSGSGTTWTINPATTLAANTSYALRADRKAFVDGSGAIFFGREKIPLTELKILLI